jgi:hypothetical protein
MLVAWGEPRLRHEEWSGRWGPILFGPKAAGSILACMLVRRSTHQSTNTFRYRPATRWQRTDYLPIDGYSASGSLQRRSPVRDTRLRICCE